MSGNLRKMEQGLQAIDQFASSLDSLEKRTNRLETAIMFQQSQALGISQNLGAQIDNNNTSSMMMQKQYYESLTKQQQQQWEERKVMENQNKEKELNSNTDQMQSASQIARRNSRRNSQQIFDKSKVEPKIKQPQNFSQNKEEKINYNIASIMNPSQSPQNSKQQETLNQQSNLPLESEPISMDFHKSKKIEHNVQKKDEIQPSEEQFLNKQYYSQNQRKKELNSGQKNQSNKNENKFSEIQKNQESFCLEKKEQEEDAVSLFESDEGNDIINDFGIIGSVNENSQVNPKNLYQSGKLNEQFQSPPSKEHELESSSASNKKKNLSITVQEQTSSQVSPETQQKKKEEFQPSKSKKVNKFFDMREKDQQIQEQENQFKQTTESSLAKQQDLLDFHFTQKKLVDSPKQQQFMGSMDKMKKNAQFFQNLNADPKSKELPPLNERTVKNFQKMKEIEQERIREQQELQRQHSKINQFQQFMHQAIANPSPPPQRQLYANQFGSIFYLQQQKQNKGQPLGMNQQYNQFQDQPNDEDVEELVYQLDENGFLMDEQGNYLQDEFGKRVKLTQEELDNLRAQNLIEEEEI